MSSSFPGGPPEQPARSVYYQETPDTSRPPMMELAAGRWTTSPGYNGPSAGFGCTMPPISPGNFGSPPLVPPYVFHPSVPPPPPGHFPGPPSFHTFSPQFTPVPRSHFQVMEDASPRQQEQPATPCSTDDDERRGQRKRDQLWLQQFLLKRHRISRKPLSRRESQVSVLELRDELDRATQLVHRLSQSCETLKTNLDNLDVWNHSYLTALGIKSELQTTVSRLSQAEWFHSFVTKLSYIKKTRVQRSRCRRRIDMEARQRETSITEKEAAIDGWRMKQIQQVEERKKEQELKLAADTVLCEVRKKQADVKRMQDVLRSLEKLRKLREEAASRKGIFTERESGEAFISQLERLRSVMRKRTVIYSAEEKALMVMLEGVQEEERKRDQETRRKKDKETQIQRRQQVDVMLFGDGFLADPVLQSFREYYTQAEHSLYALVQIRREWDMFLAAADHPDGTAVPQSWILPEIPSDPFWASALLSDSA
ncbi:programmed cell death protein 7 [Aulostomus maculatus]